MFEENVCETAKNDFMVVFEVSKICCHLPSSMMHELFHAFVHI